MNMDWQSAPASPSSFTVKRILRLEIPVDTFPNVSFQTNSSYRKSSLIIILDTFVSSFLN